MKIGHTFMPQHGFTGSANIGADMRPKIPGYARGGMEMGEHEEHDDHPKHDGHHHYDEHGFEVHKKHSGKVKKHKE